MDIVYATVSASVPLPDGGTAGVGAGTHWRADDPVVKAAPAGMFSPDPRYGLNWYGPPPPEMAEPPVEQATSAPGERRGAVRRG
jgi:hypothetical protein